MAQICIFKSWWWTLWWTKGLSKTDLRAIVWRLFDLGYHDPNPPLARDCFSYPMSASQASRYQPWTFSAPCADRVLQVLSDILIVWGSLILVVSERFENVLCTVAYSGNDVTIADYIRIRPDSVIHSNIIFGSDPCIVPLVVFTDASVNILLGTDGQCDHWMG